MGYPVKVTYAKSSKKGAKRYTKNYSTVITIKNPSLSVSASEATVNVGESVTVKATAKPSSAKVTYTSADKSIATVSSQGVITGVAAGTTSVTAKAVYGTKTVSKKIAVTVKAVEPATNVSITSIEAKTASTLVATLANPVSADAKVEVTKAGIVTPVAGEVKIEDTTVTFSTKANLSKGTYTMTITDGDSSDSKSVEVLDEYVKEIVITSENALTKAGDKKTAYVFYDVFNQYGESIRLQTTINWTSSAKTIKADKTTGKLTITSDQELVYGNQIYVTGVYTKTGVSVQKAVSVGMERALNTVKAVGFANKNKPSEKLDSLPVDFAKNTYYMIYETRDQENNLMDAEKYVADKSVAFISDNILLVKIATDEQIFTIDGIEYSGIAIEPGQYVDKGGEVNITAIANKTGQKSNTNFVVGANGLLQSLSITGAADGKTIADGDTNKELAYVAKDTNGNTVTNYETIVRSTNSLTLSCGEGELRVNEEDDGTAGIYWSDAYKYTTQYNTAAATDNGWNNNESADEIDRTIPLTTVVVGGESNNYLLSVSDKRRPVAINAIKSINSGANAIVEDGTATVRFNINDDVEYIDQYGETMKADDAAKLFDFAYDNDFGKGTKYKYGVKADFSSDNSLTSVDKILRKGAYTLTLTAQEKAAVINNTVKFSIAQFEPVSDASKNINSPDDWDVAGKVLSLTIATVPIGKLSNLGIPALNKQYVDSDLTDYNNAAEANKTSADANDAVTSNSRVTTEGEVKVTGTYDGKTLEVPNAYLVRRTDNFLYGDGTKPAKITAVSGGALKLKDLYDINSAQLTRKDGSLDAVVDVYATTGAAIARTEPPKATCKTKVVLSDEKSKAAKVEWVYNAKAVENFTINAFDTDYRFVDITGSVKEDTRIENDNELWVSRYWTPSVVVYDQYGKYYVTDSVEFTIKDYTENTGAFAHVDNNSSIAANGSADTNISGAELGDTFTITASIEGVSATAKVTLGSDGKAKISTVVVNDTDKNFRSTKLGYER